MANLPGLAAGNEPRPAISLAAAEQAMEARSQRRYRGKSLKQVKADVKSRWSGISRLGRRMFEETADLGLAVAALKRLSPHGAFLPALQELGVSNASASRARELAIYREALPENPPPELGEVWTDQAALEFGKALFTMPDDVPQGERIPAAARVLKDKRVKARSSNLPSKVLRLETEIGAALHNADPGAQEAVDAMKNAAARLDAMAKQLAGENGLPPSEAKPRPRERLRRVKKGTGGEPMPGEILIPFSSRRS